MRILFTIAQLEADEIPADENYVYPDQCYLYKSTCFFYSSFLADFWDNISKTSRLHFLFIYYPKNENISDFIDYLTRVVSVCEPAFVYYCSYHTFAVKFNLKRRREAQNREMK
jgi:hypothetical protein